MSDNNTEKPGAVRPFLLVCAGALIIASLCLSTISKNTWIPNANLVHVANVAKNLAKGKGYISEANSDYLVQRGGARHPEDAIPLGLPTVMAPFFMVAGANVFTSCLPAVLFFLGLGFLTYWVGKSRFGVGVGLVAAFLVWMDTNLSEIALNGLSDTAFALFFLASLHFMERCLNEVSSPKAPLWAGLSAGMAFHMKFEALILPAAFILLVFLIFLKGGYETRVRKIRRLAVFCLVFLLVVAPWVMRNLYDFRSFIYPGSPARCAMGIENPGITDSPGPIIPIQRIYTSQNAPGFGKIIGERGFDWLFIVKPKFELVRFISLALNYRVLALGLMIFGLLGGFWGWTAGHRQWVLWNLVVAIISLVWLMAGANGITNFVVFVPPAALLGAYFLVEFGNWIRAEISLRSAVIFGALMAVLFGITSVGYWRYILKPRPEVTFARKLDMLNLWARKNVRADEVIITRMPQHVACGASRPTIATPMVGWEALLNLSRAYGARYLVIEQGPQVAREIAGSKAADVPIKEWEPLLRGEEIFGAQKVYSDGEFFFVYLLPGAGSAGGNAP